MGNSGFAAQASHGNRTRIGQESGAVLRSAGRSAPVAVLGLAA
jgi:hypothetical protein